MPEKEEADQVMVTVSCYILSTARQNMNDLWGRRLHREMEDGVDEYRLGRFTVRESDSTARQDQFLLGLEAVQELIISLALSKQLIQDFDGELDLHITLAPESGQAGIVIPSHIIHQWSIFNLNIIFDSLSR